MSQLDDTYGCLFLIVIFNTALWAVSCIQLWFYIEKYYNTDKLWLKNFVVLLWILNTVYLVLAFKFLYVYFVKEFGNTDFLNNLPKDIYHSAPFSPVICAMVQLFFVVRAWNLSNQNYILAGVLSLSVLSQFTVGVIYIVKLGSVETLDESKSLIAYESAMNVIIFVTDTAIALVLIYLLRRRRSSFKKTENIIKRLVAFAIGTGLIVGIMMIVAFVFALARPDTLVYITLDYCLAKMYYNCMLASLNARSGLLRRLNGATAGMSIHLDDIVTDTTGAESRTRAAPVLPPTVTSNSHRDHLSGAIECRVDIEVSSDSSTRKCDSVRFESDFHQDDKVGSMV